MYISWCPYVNIILFVFTVLADASNLARTDKHLSPDRGPDSAILPQASFFPGSYKKRHSLYGSADAMTKRDDEQDDELRVRRIHILTGSVPIAAAACSLERFYNAILCNALAHAHWSSRPPPRVLMISMGPLQLRMSVFFDAGIAQGIPWVFVQNFARNMVAMTARGFTGTYNMYYMRGDYGVSSNPPGLGVEVRLRILWGL